MPTTYDPRNDSAYVAFIEDAEQHAIQSHRCECAPLALDFDAHGKLVGMRVIEHASKMLPDDLLETAPNYPSEQQARRSIRRRITKIARYQSLAAEEEERSQKGRRYIFRTTVDNSADAAYIYLTANLNMHSERQYVFVPVPIILDFDDEGRVLGIEILGKGLLPDALLRKAIRL